MEDYFGVDQFALPGGTALYFWVDDFAFPVGGGGGGGASGAYHVGASPVWGLF